MKKIYLLLLAVFAFAAITNAQVSVTATAGTTGPTAYTTLKGAFDAINAGTHQGAIIVEIAANTTEGTTPATLNSTGAGSAIYTSVLIRPTADGVSVSGNPAAGFGVIQLKGADNVTIDGDNPGTAGTNRNLTINNTATSTVVGNSVIRIATAATVVTSADNITIKNCILYSNVTSGNASAITSATGSSGISFGIYCGGNGGATAIDAPTAITSATTQTAPAGTTINNLIIDNNIVNQCSRAIQFNGAVATNTNSLTITNNVIGTAGAATPAIPPFTSPATTVYSKGIWVGGTTSVTITGNTLQNVMSYISTTLTAIELVNPNLTSTVSNNTINTLSNNGTVNIVKAILVTNSATTYTVSGNTITNIQALASSSGTDAIEATSAATNPVIELNKISNIVNRSASTFGAWGINITAGTGVNIRNNFISDINMDMTGGGAFSTQFSVHGIRITGGINHKVYHNTIHLADALLGTATTSILTSCLTITSTAVTGMDVRNNIFSNVMTGGTTSIAHVSLSLPSGATNAMNLTLNNNAYYSGADAVRQGIAQAGTTAGTGFYLASNFNANSTTPATNLRAYTSVLSTAGTNDNGSFAVTTAAPFVSATDLHIPAATASLLESGGASVGITTDIDGQVRPGPAGSVNGGALAPDMGADEFDGFYTDVVAPSITYTALSPVCSTGDRAVTGVTITDLSGVPTTGSLRPRIYYKKNAGTWFSQPGTLATGTATNGTWNFNIVAADMGGIAASDVISYFVIAQDIAATPNISSNPSGAVATNVNTVTTYPTTPNTYVIGTNLSGTYTVGVGGNYTTLTSAVAAYNGGCLSGPVVFNLIDASYPSETYPISINQNAYASSVNTLTIKPNAAGTTLSGSVSSTPIIKVLGNYVTFNGSSTLGTSRDLTITNTNTTAPSVILFGSTGTTPIIGSGLKNTIIINGSNTASAVLIGDGPSLVVSGGYFNNLTIQNNSIQNAYIGIYNFAIATAGNGSELITQNDLNTSGANAIRLVAIYEQGTDGAVISNNNIGNMANTLDAANLTGIWLATATINTTISGNNITAISGTAAGPRGIAISTGVTGANINITGNTISDLSSGAALATSGVMLFSTTAGVTIQKNRIRNITNTTAIGTYGLNLATTLTGANINVSNNLISNVTSLGSATSTSNGNGIVISAGSGYNIYHNTVNLGSEQTATAGIPAAINITSGVTAAGAVNLVDNIFTTSQTVGTPYAIYSGAANTVFGTIDYNDYYSTGANLGFIGSNRVDLAAVQTGFGGNTNSKNILPVYVSASDVHLNAGYNPTLNNLGTPIGTITTDFDGDVRSATTPDMGADEFNPCTPPSSATASSNSPICAGSTLNLTGVTNGTTYSWSGPNAFTSTALSPSIPNASLAAAGIYTFQSFLAGCPSLAAYTTVAITTSPTVTSVTATNPTICLGGTTDLNSSAVSNLPGTPVLTEGFESGIPATWVTVNGGTGNNWAIGPINGSARTGTKAVEYVYNLTQAASAYLITSGIALTGGTTYTVSSWYRNSGATFPEKLKVTVGTAQTIAAQTTTIQDVGTVSSATYLQQTATFTPATSGTYYFAWNAYSAANEFYLNVDDISITAPAPTPTYSWTSSPAGFTSSLQNPTGVAPTVTTTYTVTATNGVSGCTGSGSVTVTVNTPPTVSNPSNITVCNNSTATFTVTATGNPAPTYQWQLSTAGVGGPWNNISNGAPYSGVTLPTLTINPAVVAMSGYAYRCVVTGSCTPSTATSAGAVLTVNPIPTVNTVANQSTCNGTATTAVTFSGAVAGTVYNWTNNTTSIGLAASGTGNIASFTGVNTGTTDVVATVTVTPSYTNAGTTCTGTATTFTITIKPTPVATAVLVQPTTCAAADGSITLTLSGAPGPYSFAWTGPGVNANAQNQTGLTVGNYNVTVTAGNNCTYSASFTLLGPGGCFICPTVPNVSTNPTPTTCIGSTVTLTSTGLTNMGVTYGIQYVSFAAPTATPYTGGTILTTVPNGSLTSSGTVATGTTTFAAAGTYNIYAILTPTPVDPACRPSATTTLTINPTPTVNAVANQVVCNGANTTAVTFTGTPAGVVYNWTNNTTSIGLAASGTGNIASFVATNATGAAVTATITVTPSYTAAGATCTGTPTTFTITVNPTPTVNTVANQVVCNNTSTTAVTFSGNAATAVYNWTNNTTSIGLAASGTGNIAAFTAVNTGTTPVVATITVTPTFTNGAVTCTGTAKTFTITVNPTPNATISYPGSPYCQSSGTAAVTQTGTTGGAYTSTTGLSLNGTTGAVTLGTSTPGTYTVTYTIAAAGGCAQFTTTASITVTATPNATIAYTGSPYCQNSGTATVTQTGTTGGTYSSTTGLSINGTTGLITLGTSTPGTYTVTYTVAAAGGCAQYTTTASVTVTATPNATISYAGSPYCGTGTATVTRTGTTGGTYSSTAGLVINSTTGDVNLATSTPGSYTVTYTVAAAGGCSVFTTTANIVINTFSVAPTGATTSVVTNCGPATGVVLTVTGGSLGAGGSWKWYTGSCGGTLVGTGASITVNVTGTTTYYVRAEGTCNTTTCASVTTTIYTQPTISIAAAPYTKLMPGWNTTLTATINPVVASNTIVWYKDGSPVTGATSSTLNVTVDDLGTYTARVTTVNLCTALSNAITISDSTTEKLFIYPNPNNGKFTIRFHTTAQNFGFLRNVLIYDEKGAVVYDKLIPITGPYSAMSIDMRNRAKGIYTVVLTDYNGSISSNRRLATGKVVIQ